LIEMAGKSWANVVDKEEESVQEEVKRAEEELKSIIEANQLQYDFINILNTILDTVGGIQALLGILVAEMQLANKNAFGKVAIDIENSQSVETVKTVINSSKNNVSTSERKAVDIENLEGEEKIEAYLKNRLREVKTNNGTPVFSGSDFDKMNFGFGEDKIVFKPPYIGGEDGRAKFAALASFIRDEFGGEYVGGRGAHFVIPYPDI